MNQQNQTIHHRGKLITILLWLGIPLLLIGILAVVFVVNNRPVTVLIPAKTLPNPNGYDDFLRANSLRGHILSPVSDSSRRPESWTVAEYQAFVADNAQAMAAVREGLNKEYLMPPVRDAFAAGPHYAQFREMARILVGESLYYRKVGQPAKAAGSCLDAVEYGVTIPHGGPFIAMLVGSAAEAIGCSSLSEVLPELSPEELAGVSVRLERIESKRVDFSDVVIEEGYTSVSSVANMAQAAHSVGMKRLISSSSPPTAGDLWGAVRYAFSNKNAGYRQVLAYCKAIAAGQKGYYTGKVNVKTPSHPLVKAMLDPSLINRVRVQHCRTQAITTVLQTEVALRRYRFDHGSYPASLKQLSPKYLTKTPVDPFGQGKPLCYKPLKDGQDFLLYSRGPNLKDDGGKDEPWNKGMGKDLVAVKQTL